jgi:hypothetical protein
MDFKTGIRDAPRLHELDHDHTILDGPIVAVTTVGTMTVPPPEGKPSTKIIIIKHKS